MQVSYSKPILTNITMLSVAMSRSAGNQRQKCLPNHWWNTSVLYAKHTRWLSHARNFTECSYRSVRLRWKQSCAWTWNWNVIDFRFIKYRRNIELWCWYQAHLQVPSWWRWRDRILVCQPDERRGLWSHFDCNLINHLLRVQSRLKSQLQLEGSRD